MLLDWELVMADGTYIDLKCCNKFNYKNEPHKKAMAKCRARHETINRRFKQYKVLQMIFRHHRDLHVHVFEAVAALVQIQMAMGKGPFQITDYEDTVRDNI
jgi:hypothetical protein